MSATLTTAVRPEATKRASGFFQLFSACFDGIARYFVCRAAIENLREFDNRALRDIGLERSHIEAAVYGRSFRPGEDVMMACSAGMGPCADGRPRASTAEAASWN